MALRLQHIHLPSAPARGIYPTYAAASALQELLRRQFLDAKDGTSSTAHVPPTLLSFTPQPTFTLGRRQAEAALSAAELTRLKAPLSITTSSSPGPSTAQTQTHVFQPAVLASPRGGLTTYHGPGQVVLWPVLDLKSPRHRQFSVRCYSRLLETTTMAVLARLWGLKAFTTEDPGVWVRSVFPPPPPAGSEGDATGEEEETRKIAALGVHLRRHISSLGTAINLSMPTTRGGVTHAQQDHHDEDQEATNPWARFVACGLAGKGVTCVAAETQAAQALNGRGDLSAATAAAAVGCGERGTAGLDAGAVASAWAAELAGALGVESVEEVGEAEVESLLARAREQQQERAGYVAPVEEAL